MPLNRRSLLTVGAGAAAGLAATGLVGCSPGGSEPSPEPSCVARSSLTRHRTLRRADLIYDISEKNLAFRFDDGFFDQLGRWLDDYRKLTDTGRPDQIWTYGSWLDGTPDCDSWHDAGRAFDLSRLVIDGSTHASARYDIWQHYSGARLRRFRSRYWALAASLHLHFAYVLTYLYNPIHHNHLHIDNGRSGDQLSSFDARSTAQAQAVQAMLRHLWDHDVEITGSYDRATAKAARTVLKRIRIGGDLDDGDQQWHGFLRASAARPAR